jgi:hypothetical protein
MYYIGFDVHKKTISYCAKDGGNTRHATDSGHVDTTVDGGHGSDHFHGVDLRSSQATCSSSEGGAD